MKNLSKHKNNRRAPLVSVVMPVYNAEKYLKDSIESILTQTFTDFEFIIVDDKSTDSSFEIIKKYAKRDHRIHAFRNPTNMKQAKTVNFAITQARGQYIARMDADDVSLPTRLKKQLDYLRKHRKTVAVGSQCFIIDGEGVITGEKKFPEKFKDIYKYIFKFCPAQQPTFMIARNRLPEGFEFYNHNMAPVEDVEFLFKLFSYGRVENMSDYLLMYRIHGENSSLKNFRKSFLLTFISRFKGILFHGYKPDAIGIIFTISQAFAVFLLPQKVNRYIYEFVKNATDNPYTSTELEKKLAYQF